MAYTEATRKADEERKAASEEARKHNYPDTKPLPDPVFDPFDVVFSGEGPHLEFVEVEKTFGHETIRVGEMWIDNDGYRRLTIVPGDRTGAKLWELADKRIPFSLHFEPQTDPYENPWTIEIGSVAFGGMTPSETAEFAQNELSGGCQCEACRTTGPHMSDCAVHGVDVGTPDNARIEYKDCTCRATEPDMICEAHPWRVWPHDDCIGPGMPTSNLQRLLRRKSVVVTERGPGETWLLNLDRFNSEDDIEISPVVGKAILGLIARDEEE